MSAKRRADDQASSAKKQRFDQLNPSTLAADDEPDDQDTILELDEIGRGGRLTKRTGVRIDGYDSDSSTENFDQRAEAIHKARKADGSENGSKSKSKHEEDNDMFADVDQAMARPGDADSGNAGHDLSKPKKEVRFMQNEDIVGQIDTSQSGGHVKVDFAAQPDGMTHDEVESSSDSGDDSDRAALDPELEDADELGAGSKKRHAPKLDAFNLKRETAEDGQFDEAGNFVRNAADSKAVHDTWMDGFNKRDLRKAKEAHEKRERDLKRSHAESDSVLTSDLLASLITRLVKTETPLEALQRLGTGRKPKHKRQQPAWKQKRKKKPDADAMDVDVQVSQDPVADNDTEDDPIERQRKAAVEAITESADQLLSRGQLEIYDMERELLVRQYKRETGEDWTDPAADDQDLTIPGRSDAVPVRQWEYRWSDARDGGERHGPYDGPTMEAWDKAGYFGVDVEYRAVGETGWKRDVDFV